MARRHYSDKQRAAALAGVPITVSPWLPPGAAILVYTATLARDRESLWRVTELTPGPPSPIDIVWRDCRRYIARSCPLTAPPEWAALEDLALIGLSGLNVYRCNIPLRLTTRMLVS